ncbi:MAG: ATP-binding protein [Leadbetterella sp.]|nr:ATP-binding protein [Leadbetterella sp.]
MAAITYKQILRQLKADLIGKDSYRGVTLTYSWLANQFGHFSLGYIPVLMINALMTRFAPHWSCPERKAALIVSGIWLLFELYNFLGPLLFNKVSDSDRLYLPSGKKYVFPPQWSNIAFDTFTDLLFFWIGAFSASLFLHYSGPVLLLVLVLVLLTIYPAYRWYLTKMFLQYARLPVQFRLSQWYGDLDKGGIKRVSDYINQSRKSAGNHLLILGGRRTGKTLLAMGIATEMAIRHASCSNYTAIKLFDLLDLDEDAIRKTEGNEVWTWRSASLLFIDDINSGEPLSTEAYLSPENILLLLESQVNGIPNTETLRNKNVIWVVSINSADSGMKWTDMLRKAGVDPKKISPVTLGFS